MNYAVEMGSCAMMYIPSFIDWFRHSEVNGGGGCTDTQTHTHTQKRRYHKHTFIF
jgi:hypothetical protein